MPILRILLSFALGATTPALAETLSTATGTPAASVDHPNRGSTMATVQNRFGEPTQRHATVGSPPITRWDYPRFSVYFENDRVLHSVLVRSAPAS
ncbi:MAG: phosphodiesterase [Gammaproteobacteria bacterium]|nr:phosphodiesterase [Gammaproteobacteria bacterium]